jgi:hypothetical protein
VWLGGAGVTLSAAARTNASLVEPAQAQEPHDLVAGIADGEHPAFATGTRVCAGLAAEPTMRAVHA